MNSIEKTWQHWIFYILRKLLQKSGEMEYFWKLSQEDMVRIKSWFKLDNKKFECVEVNWKSKMLSIEQRVPQGLGLSHFLQKFWCLLLNIGWLCSYTYQFNLQILLEDFDSLSSNLIQFATLPDHLQIHQVKT